MTRKSDITERPLRIAVFPGSFNPFTIGHLSILKRALQLFDKVIVGVGYNEHKSSAEGLARRVEDIRRAVGDMEGVEVEAYSGLTVNFAKSRGAAFLVRGVRDTADFEYERNIADVNREVAGIDTLFLTALPDLGFISSSMVRELQHNGYDVSRFLPPENVTGIK